MSAARRKAAVGGRKRLRMGVVGIGGMGHGHCIRIAEDVREMELAAVCDDHAPTAEKTGAEFKVPHFASHGELIRSGLCDAVVVATPHPFHPPVAIDCMKASLHVLSEKPLSENVLTAAAMLRAAKRHKVVLGVMFQKRFDPTCRKALDLVARGALGRLIRATLVSPTYRSQAYYDAGDWRATWAGEGGGVLINQSPHIVDLFVNLTGLPATVRGMTATKMHRIEVEDLAEAALTFRGGGTGYLYCTTNEPGPGEMIELYGDRGKLVFRNWQLRLFRYAVPVAEFTRKNKQMWAAPPSREVALKIASRPTGHADVMRNFARHILAGEELRCSGESAMGQLELANAITLSSHLGKPVKLPIDRRAYDRLLARLRRTSTFRKKKGKTKRITDPAFVKK